MNVRPLLAPWPLLALVAASRLAVGGDRPIEPLMLEGDPAPGTGRAYQNFDRPSLAPNGTLAFTADLDGSTDADDVVTANGVVVARENDVAPGTFSARFDGFEFFEAARQVNDEGRVAFVADLRDDPLGRTRGLFLDDTVVLLEGDPIAALPGVHVLDFGFVGLTADGRVGCVASLDGPASENAAVLLDGAVIYRKGGPVPGLADATFDGIFDDLQVNARGDLIVEGNTSLPASGDRVLLRRLVGAEGTVVEEIVAREGEPLDLGAGEVDELAIILQVAFAEDGGWALRGNLRNATADTDSIVIDATGVLERQGRAVPELPGADLGNVNAIARNARGDVALLADLSGDLPIGVDEGIFVNGALLVTDGTPAPGLPEGTVLSDLGFEDLALDDAGRLVFAASYSGSTNGDGLFVVDLGPGCAADLDGDGVVAEHDLLALMSAWGPCAGGGCAADLDDDGLVAFDDMLLLLAGWGLCP